MDRGGGVAGSTGGGFSSLDLRITNSIVAGNSDVGFSSPDLWAGTGPLTTNHSLIGRAIGTGLAEAPIGAPDGNLVGGMLAGIDPLLGPLADNAGPTRTHALLPGSPAIESGDPTILPDPIEFDQRGDPFLRVAAGHRYRHGRL